MLLRFWGNTPAVASNAGGFLADHRPSIIVKVGIAEIISIWLACLTFSATLLFNVYTEH